MCSGFGTVICGCIKEASVMVVGTIDGFYPDFFEIFAVLALLVFASIFGIGVISVLLEKNKEHLVYSGFLLANLIPSFVMAQVFYGETISEFYSAVGTLWLNVVGSILISQAKEVETKDISFFKS